MKLYIGENLKKLREEKKVTQDTLAEYLGVTYQAVSRWENGAAYPDIELLPEIARFFGVSLEELMGCENSEREAERKAIEIANRRWDPNVDRKELLRELHELERQFPNNWEIKELICSTIADPMPENIEEFLPELRRYGRAVLERFRAFDEEEAKLFLWFCRTMTIAETEDHVTEWAERLPWKVDIANQRDNVMKIRYQERKDWETCRHYESEQILTHLHEITHRGPIPETETDIPKSGIFLNHYIAGIYDAVLGTPYLDENGIVHNSIYLHERADTYFGATFAHIGTWAWRGTEQEVEDGLVTLAKAVDYVLLYGDALKQEFFTCDNPYLEPQPVENHMFINMEIKRQYMREKAVDWAIENVENHYHADVMKDERFQAQLRRLYDKKAELEEYWRDRE